MQFVTDHTYPTIKLNVFPIHLKAGVAFVVITALMGPENLMFRSSTPDYYYF